VLKEKGISVNNWPWANITLALGLILAASTLGNAFLEGKRMDHQTIHVTGSAQQPIVSDLAVWRLRFSRQSGDLSQAYQALRQDLTAVQGFLQENGIPASAIEVSPAQNIALYAHAPNGNTTNQIEAYRLDQSVKVESTDVAKLTQLSQKITVLIERGIGLESQPPEFHYTKLNDLKVTMLGKAMANAKQRAEQMAASVGSRIGPLRAGQMGVFQITPKNSNEVSDYGINDTSSREKTVTAVVNATFAVQ
jgi:hypothetical protein